MKLIKRFLPVVALAALCGSNASADMMSDTAIKDRIISAIDSDPNVHQKGTVNIDVRNGVAYFSGSVDNHRTIDAMLSQALMVRGVKNIESNVAVKGFNESLRARYNAEHDAYRSK